MIRLAATWGDAFTLNRTLVTPEDTIEPLAQLVAACRAVGRDAATVLCSGYVTIALARSDAQTALRGSAEMIAAQLHAFHQAGIQHLTCFLDAGDPTSPPDALPLLTTESIERCAPIVEALRRLEE